MRRWSCDGPLRWGRRLPRAICAPAPGFPRPPRQTGPFAFLSSAQAVKRQVSPGKLKPAVRSEEHTSELQSLRHIVCRLLLEKKKNELQYLDLYKRSILQKENNKNNK